MRPNWEIEMNWKENRQSVLQKKKSKLDLQEGEGGGVWCSVNLAVGNLVEAPEFCNLADSHLPHSASDEGQIGPRSRNSSRDRRSM